MSLARMLSYAQNHEDVFLRRRVFSEQATGFYIDVGANDPLDLSITKHFYESGWRGINIEPVPFLYDRLMADRPRDINLNVGISNRTGEFTLYQAGTNAGLSTLSAEMAATHRAQGIAIREYPVQVATLAAISGRYAKCDVDFLSIDVENHERAVLEGADWKSCRPRIVLVESTVPLTNVPTHEQWEEVLFGADYLFATFDGVNRYYVRAEDRALLPRLQAPVNATDVYIPYEFQQRINEFQQRINESQQRINESQQRINENEADLQSKRAVLRSLAMTEELAPLVVRIAGSMHRFSVRFPKAFAIARKVFRAARRKAA